MVEERAAMTQPSHWDTIESALHDSMSTRGAMTEAEYERWIADCEAALAFVAEQSAPVEVQPVQAMDLANVIRARWGADWHKEGRDLIVYDEACNDVLALLDVIDALQGKRPAAEVQPVPVEALEYVVTHYLLSSTSAPLGDRKDYHQQMFKVQEWLGTLQQRTAAEAQPVQQPDWSQAPEWAMWWCVQPSGIVNWSSTKPVIRDAGHAWATTEHYPDDWWYEHGFEKVDLPLGVDWRETLRKRPAAEAVISAACTYCDGTGKIGYACGACGGTGQQPPWMQAEAGA